jgi:hypothetical protein
MPGSVAHTPTDGLSGPYRINLSGTGVTAVIAGEVYKVSLNVSGSPNPSSVALTATLKDMAGNTFSSANGNAVTWKSQALPVATVNGGGTVTTVGTGQGVIECTFPVGDGTYLIGTGLVYAQLIVTVGP